MKCLNQLNNIWKDARPGDVGIMDSSRISMKAALASILLMKGYKNALIEAARDNSTLLPLLHAQEVCICPILPKVATRTEILILRHIWEAERPSNTGRLVALATLKCENYTVRRRGSDRSCPTWWCPAALADTRHLASLAGRHRCPSDFSATGTNRGSGRATWQQARRLYSRTPALQVMPRFVLPVPDKEKRLREAHRSDGMSTVEAVAVAICDTGRKRSGGAPGETLRWSGSPNKQLTLGNQIVLIYPRASYFLIIYIF